MPPGRTLSQNDWPDNLETNTITVKSETVTCGRAVLLGPLTLLLFAQAPLLNKFSCFVSSCVSSDNSFLNVE